MKSSISSLDLRYIVREFQELISAKVVKIYNPLKKELVFSLHMPKVGKKILRLMVPNYVYTTDYKSDYPESPSGFCMFLRKRLNNSRIRRVEQKGFERILELDFETKDNYFILIIEMFSKGNVILCDKEYKIIGVLEVQKWAAREVKPRVQYIFPDREDVTKIDIERFSKFLDSKKPLVKKLALDVSLGGVYAEEVCFMSKIDKNTVDLSEKEVKTVYDKIMRLFDMKVDPQLVYDKEEVKDIVPFKLGFYSAFDNKKSESFNSAFDKVLTTKLKSEIKENVLTGHTEKIGKQEKILQVQSKQVDQMEKDIEDANKKAELIFSNYQLVEEIIKEIKKEMKNLSLNEMKKKLKGKEHKVLKDIIPKDKKIVIEL